MHNPSRVKRFLRQNLDLDALLALPDVIPLQLNFADLARPFEMRAATGDARETWHLPIATFLRLVAVGADNVRVILDDLVGRGLEERNRSRDIFCPPEINARFICRDVRTDLLDALQILISQFQNKFRREVQPHETVSPLPVNRHRDGIAHLESVTILQRINNLLPILPRLNNSSSADGTVIAFLSTREGVENRLCHGDVIPVHACDARVQAGEVGVLPEDFFRHDDFAVES